MKKNKISKDWLNKQKRDPFFKRSKVQGYRSRSAFKLMEMNKKFKFIKKRSLILDLGACPGGWTQVASQEILTGKILAVDIKHMENINKVDFLKGNFCEDDINKKILNHFDSKIDVVMSDIATNTTGNKELDAYRTGELCLKAMNLALKILKKDGVFLSKVFMGAIFKEINEKAENYFKRVVKYKPLSSKKQSKEIYIFCEGVLKI